MKHDNNSGQPPGFGPTNPPELEELPSISLILRWLDEQQARDAMPDDRFAGEDTHEYRPTLRPPVPVLTVLDDGSRDYGEEFRIRTDSFSIGRTVGTLKLPNDPSISGAHAEIRRVPWKGGYQWHLLTVCASACPPFTCWLCVVTVMHVKCRCCRASRPFTNFAMMLIARKK